jgi:GGDEF domain-containing protein
MPDTAAAEAGRVAQRAKDALAGLVHPMVDGSQLHVSCSAGLALYPRDGNGGRDLLRAADAAMYADKRARADGKGPGRPARAGTASGGASRPAGSDSAGPARHASVPIGPEPKVNA